MKAINWKHEAWMIALIVGMFVYVLAIWPLAPEKIPVHWNLNGDVDRYGGKFEGLLLTPLIGLGLYLLLLVVPSIDPGKANYKSFAGTFFYIRLMSLLLLVAIFGATQLVMFGYHVDISLMIGVLVGLMFLFFGNVMSKIRPNWFVGIRTPWTLSSHLSWNKTHRLGGWLFIIQGILLIALGVLKSGWLLWTMLGTMAVSVLALVVYSYLVWRSDPNPIPVTGVSPAEPDDPRDLSDESA